MSDTVLFVDDEPNVLEGFKRQLQERVYVDTAIGPEEGLQGDRRTRSFCRRRLRSPDAWNGRGRILASGARANPAIASGFCLPGTRILRQPSRQSIRGRSFAF